LPNLKHKFVKLHPTPEVLPEETNTIINKTNDKKNGLVSSDGDSLSALNEIKDASKLVPTKIPVKVDKSFRVSE